MDVKQSVTPTEEYELKMFGKFVENTWNLEEDEESCIIRSFTNSTFHRIFVRSAKHVTLVDKMAEEYTR
jgi:hypothetical protein